MSMLVVLLQSSVSISSPPYSVEWTKQFGTVETDAGIEVATDKSGNVFVTGYTYGSLGGPSFGRTDAYLRKFDSHGNVVWTRQLGTDNWESSYSVAVDGSGNVLITGYTEGNFGGPNLGGADAFVAKLDGSGNVLWTSQLGTTSHEKSNAVTVDRFDNVYISGYTEGGLQGTNAGAYDAFVTKLDSSGAAIWTKQFGTQGYEESYAIAADATGSLYISGWTLAGAFVTKLDSLGNTQWTKQYGTNSGDRSTAVAVDEFDNVYVTGFATGSIGGVTAGASDAFIVKLDSSGNELWARQFGKIGHDGGSSVALDQNGNAFISGVFNEDPAGFTVNTNVFLAMYDALGNELWTQEIGSDKADSAFSVAVDMRGNVYISGYTEGDIARQNRSGDAFLVKFANPIPEPRSVWLGLCGATCLICTARQRVKTKRIIR